MSSVAIMALGLTLVIVVGEIDLSFGAMYGLGANSLPCSGSSTACRSISLRCCHRRRRGARRVQRHAGDTSQDSVLHRDARQL